MIYSIIFSECGIVNSIRTFGTFNNAKAILDLELKFHKERYSEDDDNQDEYEAIEDDDYIKASFLFKSGDIRIEFVTSELE